MPKTFKSFNFFNSSVQMLNSKNHALSAKMSINKKI